MVTRNIVVCETGNENLSETHYCMYNEYGTHSSLLEKHEQKRTISACSTSLLRTSTAQVTLVVGERVGVDVASTGLGVGVNVGGPTGGTTGAVGVTGGGTGAIGAGIGAIGEAVGAAKLSTVSSMIRSQYNLSSLES